jgi:hypothetical protein
METALFAIICGLVCGFGAFIWMEMRAVKRDIFGLNQDSNSFRVSVNGLISSTDVIEESLGEIKEILTEASRLKAMRESGLVKEPEPRQAVRGKRFIGVAERRRQAEAETMKEVSKTAVVHNNNVRAMEGK